MSRFDLSWKQGKANYFLEDETTTDVLYGGGAGGGKTVLGCVWQIKRRLKYPDTRGFIGRKTLKDLKDTTLMTFFWVANRMGLTAEVDFTYREQSGRITFPNGSIIFIRQLKYEPSDPDFGDLGSLELTDAFIDQAEQLTKKAVKTVSSRIRYNLINGMRKTLLCANPADNWLKHEYVMDKYGNPVKLPQNKKFIPALVEDNPDPDFVLHYTENLDELDFYDNRRLRYGDWSVIENDRPFFYTFNHGLHVSKIPLKIDPYSPLWLSFDFNINPTTCIVSQRLDNVGCRTYDAFERIGTEALCQAIQDAYGKHRGGFLVTGDHSGHSGSSAAGVLPGGVYNTDFEVIKSVMGLHSDDLIDTRTANARHEYSRRLCGHFLKKIPYLIDGTKDGCLPVIQDLQNGKFVKGKLYKKRDDGNAMDYGDAWRYQVSGWFQGDFSILDEYAQKLG